MLPSHQAAAADKPKPPSRCTPSLPRGVLLPCGVPLPRGDLLSPEALPPRHLHPHPRRKLQRLLHTLPPWGLLPLWRRPAPPLRGGVLWGQRKRLFFLRGGVLWGQRWRLYFHALSSHAPGTSPLCAAFTTFPPSGACCYRRLFCVWGRPPCMALAPLVPRSSGIKRACREPFCVQGQHLREGKGSPGLSYRAAALRTAPSSPPLRVCTILYERPRWLPRGLPQGAYFRPPLRAGWVPVPPFFAGRICADTGGCFCSPSLCCCARWVPLHGCRRKFGALLGACHRG